MGTQPNASAVTSLQEYVPSAFVLASRANLKFAALNCLVETWAL